MWFNDGSPLEVLVQLPLALDMLATVPQDMLHRGVDVPWPPYRPVSARYDPHALITPPPHHVRTAYATGETCDGRPVFRFR